MLHTEMPSARPTTFAEDHEEDDDGLLQALVDMRRAPVRVEEPKKSPEEQETQNRLKEDALMEFVALMDQDMGFDDQGRPWTLFNGIVYYRHHWLHVTH